MKVAGFASVGWVVRLSYRPKQEVSAMAVELKVPASGDRSASEIGEWLKRPGIQ